MGVEVITAVSWEQQVSVRTFKIEVEVLSGTYLPVTHCLAGSSGGTREATLAILEIRQKAERITICRELTGVCL